MSCTNPAIFKKWKVSEMGTAAVRRRVGTDLTQGTILKTLMLFAVPIILTNVIQQLYGMVDLIVIGRFGGSAGTVSVSTGGEMSDLVTPIATGFSSAGQIYIAQLVGAREEKRVKETIGTLLTVMFAVSVCLMAGTLLFCRPILNLLNCPPEAMEQARLYLIITTLGFPFIFGYNAVCGVLRGMGESKHPLVFVLVAAVVNIVLDILLVAVFDLQAAGTAIATALSQFGAFAAAFSFMWKRKERFDFEWNRSFFRIRKDLALVILKLAVPQVARSMMVRFSMLWINANINAYGLVVSATNSVGNKIQKFAEVFMAGVDTASSSMIGQNLGARKTERAGRVTLWTLALTLGCAAVVSAICLLVPRQIFGIFTTDAAVEELGTIYLRIMVIHFFSSAVVGAFQAMVTGSGFVTLGFAIGVLDGVICKIGLSILFVRVFQMGYVGYFLGIGCSRILPGVLCGAYYASGKWKTRKLLTEG